MDNPQQTSVRTFSLKDAFGLGYHLAYLAIAGHEQYYLRDPTSDTEHIISAFERIESTLMETDLDTVILKDIRNHRNKLESQYPSEANNPEKMRLSNSDGKSLQEAAERWRDLLTEELSKEKRVAVSSQGLFDSERAMENPAELFSNDKVWENLPQQVKDDLEEACRALAFDCLTSAVIMSLRAVEDRLYEWYRQETENDIKDRTFGLVLSELDDTYSDDGRPIILSHLDYLKERRNQVAHPERSPDKQEAESTIVMVRETITIIHNQLD